MNLQQYIDSKQGKKPNADIIERWHSRIVAQGLQNMGETGAQHYLSMYGKGIAAPKCVLLARQAQDEGYPNLALGFWKKAFELETGQSATEGADVPFTAGTARPFESVHVDDFPPNLQPGKLATMQPVDALYEREFYIDSERYWGQPKRDGNKVVIFANDTDVWYQSRSLKLRASPSPEMDDALTTIARQIGAFIIEGELYYLDCNGGEHRTAAQAATVNIASGEGSTLPLTRYMTFFAIFEGGRDMRDDSYAVRILNGNYIARSLFGLNKIFEVAKTYRTREEKAELCRIQRKHGREGEVWFDPQLRYHSGKDRSDGIVRTKYLTELNVRVTGLTPTTAEGRLFGAIEVESLDGKPLGSVGTGFDRNTQQIIVARFEAGELIIPVVSQGYTETGTLWQARLSEEFA